MTALGIADPRAESISDLLQPAAVRMGNCRTGLVSRRPGRPRCCRPVLSGRSSTFVVITGMAITDC